MEKTLISVLIVVRNEAKYIQKGLNSLLNQDFPSDKYEIVAIDGMSTDGTRQIISEYADKYPNRIRLIDNPQGTLASGWNIGIKEARGSIIIRIDGHSYVPEDFLRKNMATLQSFPDAACVGGPIISVGEDFTSRAIAKALSCPFGVGNSRFRYSKKAGYVDTIAYGAYRKDVFSEVGFFDDSLRRNQDLDMNSRIRKGGWKFYLTPEIHSYYIVRSSIRQFIKQAFENGFWVIHNFVRDKTSVSVRHLVPLLFILTLICLSAAAPFLVWAQFLLFAMLFSYFIIGFSFSIYYARKDKIVIPLLPILFFLLHISYGIGSVCAIFNLIVRRNKQTY